MGVGSGLGWAGVERPYQQPHTTGISASPCDDKETEKEGGKKREWEWHKISAL